MSILPVSVVIPVRDCMQFLVPHLEQVATWSACVDQIIVVDSSATPDCLDYARRHIQHPQIEFLTHPPGLYQSWNAGIARAASRFVYISTVGDSITRDELEHLVNTSVKLSSHITVSCPTDVTETGQASRMIWPMADVIQALGIHDEPRILPPLLAFFYATSALSAGLLGSSASNLYDTTYLQQHPFPTQYGRSGDVMLGIVACLDSVIAVTPRNCGRFLHHEKTYPLEPYVVPDLALLMWTDTCRIWNEHRVRLAATDPACKPDAIAEIDHMLKATHTRIKYGRILRRLLTPPVSRRARLRSLPPSLLQRLATQQINELRHQFLSRFVG